MGVASGGGVEVDEIEVDEFEVDGVEFAKIKSQTAKFKDHNFLLKAKYKPLDWPPKQNYLDTLTR